MNKAERLWTDTQGKRIQAHAGVMYRENGLFYWYGENKEYTHPGNGILQWGVRCYSSRDLCRWQDEGLIIAPDERDGASPLHPSSKAERPHILYCDATGKYICWMKIIREGMQRAIVLASDTFLGPYKLIREEFCPLGMQMGDFDLLKMPDGAAYIFFDHPHEEIVCARLTEDYTNAAEPYVSLYSGRKPPEAREAPAVFQWNGRLYLVTSGTTGYHPNPSEIACAEYPLGPWRVLGDFHPSDVSRTSFGSQISCIFRDPGFQECYIAMADRWMPYLRELNPQEYDRGVTYEKIRRNFEYEFSEDPALRAKVNWTVPAPDTSASDYVWLPVRLDGAYPFAERTV